MAQKVYILHKSGADSHYQGLQFLLGKNEVQLKFREFSVISKSLKSLTKFKINLFIKQWVNLGFLISLFFSKNKKVVVGIAPFDDKLTRLLPLLKNHQVYYHTSWANWDGSFVPKSKKVTDGLKDKWRFFLEEMVKVTFAVTQTTKEQLIDNYNINSDKIAVVNHSFNGSTLTFENNEVENEHSFLVVGRLLPQKGIQEILEFFSKKPNAKVTFIGTGKLDGLVQSFADSFENIHYLGYVKEKSLMNKVFNEHNFMLLNSKKTQKWEELFGMVIIEGMACGLIPVATNHPGPKEIIKSEFGYLTTEGNFINVLEDICNNHVKTNYKLAAQKASELYTVDNISKKWESILK